MATLDPHSYFRSDQPRVCTLAWKARVDFESRTIAASATLTFDRPIAANVDLDTRALEIQSVKDGAGNGVRFALHGEDPVLGQRLEISCDRQTQTLILDYRTSPQASALQWLEPSQTRSGKLPFLYSQCQAIHARSLLPIQDTPCARITFSAELLVPKSMKAVMGAGFVEQKEEGTQTLFRFEMPQPIPPYLFSLAVGELASKDLSKRCRIYAEPEVLPDAAYEFGEVENMIAAAERLFGPYDWERFDLLTMPPSFPYGGMENPRLAFLTPTLIAKDRSLVTVVAHELAHSWTGNLVTNASAEHFWLNEGFTVYAERRILEALEGSEAVALHEALGRRSLEEAVQQFSAQPELTCLRTNLVGRDPDEVFSIVPYEKGYLFLRALEQHVGRAVFDPFLKTYLQDFRFQSITSEQFCEYTESRLPGALKAINADAYLNRPGIPATAFRATSKRLESIESLGATLPSKDQAQTWKPLEWQLYLEAFPRPAKPEALQTLDKAFGLTQSTNDEILVSWLCLAIVSGETSVMQRVEEVVSQVGRMKYLRPLYKHASEHPAFRSHAIEWFERYKGRYHPVARQVLLGTLKP